MHDKVKLSNSVILLKFKFMFKFMFDSGELCQHISNNISLSLVNFIHHFDHFLELCSCQDRGITNLLTQFSRVFKNYAAMLFKILIPL